VISLVEAEFALPSGAIVGRGRKTVQVFARSIVVRILRDRGVSYPRIGDLLRRDHSTILNMDRKWPVYISQCPKVLEVYQAVEADK
jgi:chromosomal replication initiation ATPase DnaA